jgi:hypothetical protein
MRSNRDGVVDTADGQARVRWTTVDGRATALTLWPERPVTIGRDPTSAIVLASSFVSKQHAFVTWAEGEFRIADGGSANGTRVNGTPVTSSVLHDGDVIEVGDYRLTFELAAADDETDGRLDARAAPATGGGKTARLLIAALGTMIVMLGGLTLALRSLTTADAAGTVARPSRTAPTSEARPVTPAELEAFDRTRARDTAERARRTGVDPVAAMYDEAMVASRGGRYLETVQLLAGVLATDPKHEGARLNLPGIVAARERAIQAHQGEARQAEFQLRIDAAARHWEQVLLLTEPREAAHAEALQALDAIARRRSRG